MKFVDLILYSSSAFFPENFGIQGVPYFSQKQPPQKRTNIFEVPYM